MMLQAALKAQAAGFWIFPVARNDKIPHRMAGQWGQTATNDINRIIQFWTQVDPQANIGIACKPSQLLVVDLDKAKEDWNLRDTEWAYMHDAYGPRVDGIDLFDEMCFKAGDMVAGTAGSTYMVRTGSGGFHLYYRWPAHFPQQSQASPVKGVVDVRGNGGQWGGYVLGEGSVTEAGKYEQVGEFSSHAIDLPLPWIRQLVTPKPKIQAPRRIQGIQQPRAVSWAGLVASVQNAGEGNRNNALSWAARAMCTDGATEEECMRVLGPAAESAGLGFREIERTIQSSYRIQRQKEGL
jgi:hypothetical protein